MQLPLNRKFYPENNREGEFGECNFQTFERCGNDAELTVDNPAQQPCPVSYISKLVILLMTHSDSPCVQYVVFPQPYSNPNGIVCGVGREQEGEGAFFLHVQTKLKQIRVIDPGFHSCSNSGAEVQIQICLI